MELAEVGAVLWRERDLLGAVVSGLEEDAHIAPPVALALAALEHVQEQRRLAVDRAGRELGLPAGCTLADLALVAPKPWDELLRGHIVALLAATQDVTVAASRPGFGIDVVG